jgi:integrase
MFFIVACATAESTSRDPERDVLVLLLGIHTGMRVSEIAQIEVGAPTEFGKNS